MSESFSKDRTHPPGFGIQFLAASQAALERVVTQLSNERAKAESELTETQFVEALKQALACGDFLRFVSIGADSSVVTYAPYREHALLTAHIKRLEASLNKIRDALDGD